MLHAFAVIDVCFFPIQRLFSHLQTRWKNDQKYTIDPLPTFTNNLHFA